MFDMSKLMAEEACQDFSKACDICPAKWTPACDNCGDAFKGFELSIFECLKDIANANIAAGICSCCGRLIADYEDEDTIADLHRQVDALGESSLTESEQMLLGVPGMGQWCYKCYENEGEPQSNEESNRYVTCHRCGYDKAEFFHDENQVECPRCLGLLREEYEC